MMITRGNRKQRCETGEKREDNSRSGESLVSYREHDMKDRNQLYCEHFPAVWLEWQWKPNTEDWEGEGRIDE